MSSSSSPVFTIKACVLVWGLPHRSTAEEAIPPDDLHSTFVSLPLNPPPVVHQKEEEQENSRHSSFEGHRGGESSLVCLSSAPSSEDRRCTPCLDAHPAFSILPSSSASLGCRSPVPPIYAHEACGRSVEEALLDMKRNMWRRLRAHLQHGLMDRLAALMESPTITAEDDVLQRSTAYLSLLEARKEHVWEEGWTYCRHACPPWRTNHRHTHALSPSPSSFSYPFGYPFLIFLSSPALRYALLFFSHFSVPYGWLVARYLLYAAVYATRVTSPPPTLGALWKNEEEEVAHGGVGGRPWEGFFYRLAHFFSSSLYAIACPPPHASFPLPPLDRYNTLGAVRTLPVDPLHWYSVSHSRFGAAVGQCRRAVSPPPVCFSSPPSPCVAAAPVSYAIGVDLSDSLGWMVEHKDVLLPLSSTGMTAPFSTDALGLPCQDEREEGWVYRMAFTRAEWENVCCPFLCSGESGAMPASHLPTRTRREGEAERTSTREPTAPASLSTTTTSSSFSGARVVPTASPPWLYYWFSRSNDGATFLPRSLPFSFSLSPSLLCRYRQTLLFWLRFLQLWSLKECVIKALGGGGEKMTIEMEKKIECMTSCQRASETTWEERGGGGEKEGGTFPLSMQDITFSFLPTPSPEAKGKDRHDDETNCVANADGENGSGIGSGTPSFFFSSFAVGEERKAERDTFATIWRRTTNSPHHSFLLPPIATTREDTDAPKWPPKHVGERRGEKSPSTRAGRHAASSSTLPETDEAMVSLHPILVHLQRRNETSIPPSLDASLSTPRFSVGECEAHPSDRSAIVPSSTSSAPSNETEEEIRLGYFATVLCGMPSLSSSSSFLSPTTPQLPSDIPSEKFIPTSASVRSEAKPLGKKGEGTGFHPQRRDRGRSSSVGSAIDVVPLSAISTAELEHVTLFSVLLLEENVLIVSPFDVEEEERKTNATTTRPPSSAEAFGKKASHSSSIATKTIRLQLQVIEESIV